MLKILRVISSVNPAAGGPINGLVNSSRELIKQGHTVEVLCLDDPTESWVKNFEFPVVSFIGQFGTFRYSKSFSKWLDNHVSEYDVVIIHGLWQYHSFSTSKACIKNNIPYVLFTHGMLDPWFNKNQRLKTIKKNIYWKLLEKHSINNASAVLFTSEEEKILARQSFSPYTPIEKVVAYGCPLFVGNKIDLENVFYKKFPKLKGVKFGLFLSRIHTKKGIDLLIDALAKIKNVPDNFKIAIAGPDSTGLIDKLKVQIDELGLQDKIVWLGMLQDEIKWGAYHASDFFILPSHQENFGIVVAEALSTGTPVLITNKVNIWREIDTAKAGFVENDDIEGITRLLKRWFNTTDNIQLMNENAYTCYLNNFSIISAASDLENILISISN